MNILIAAMYFILCGVSVSTALGGQAFFGDPPDSEHPWAVHDVNRPQPPRVEPGQQLGGAPSDAVVLFDGSVESFERNWLHTKDPEKRKGLWRVEDGVLYCTPGAGTIATQVAFGDCQLHLEWAAPVHDAVKGQATGQKRGNSGVFLLGEIEVQILDNYNNPTYPDGTAGAVYGVMPPAVNALRPSGEWQTYDIIFRRPIVRDGVVMSEGSMTVLCNGVVIQDSTPLDGGGGYRLRKALNRAFPERAPLTLQDHGDPMRFRNIWIRPLRTRAEDGGTDGRIGPEASMEKRAEIAACIRSDAAKLDGLSKALRLLESLVYAADEGALHEAQDLIRTYLESLRMLAPDEISSEKGAVVSLARAIKYLNQHQIVPVDALPLAEVESLVDANGWRKRLYR